MLSGPFTGDPRPLSPTLVQHFCDLLAIHADDAVLGCCPLCMETRCQDWRYAVAQLTAAGELTAADAATSAPGGATPSVAHHPAGSPAVSP